MTYLVVSLASCLLFAQLLGLLLGWLLWGSVSMQRKKEIVMLRKRLTDLPAHVPRPLEEAALRGSLTGAGSEALLGDLPPLAALPPEPDSDALSSGANGNRDAAVGDLERQVETLKAQLSNISAQKEAHANQLKAQIETLNARLGSTGQHENGAQKEVELLRVQMARASAELEQQVRVLTAELNSTGAERDRVVFEVKAMRTEMDKRAEISAGQEQRLHALNSEVGIVTGEKEKAAGDLKTARADFEKRSAWLTKRIHELERSSEEWERTKQELALARRVDASKTRGEGNGASHTSDGREAAFAELKERLDAAASERDVLAAELAGHRNGATVAAASSEQVAELQESVRNKDAQLSEQVARVERLLWRVSELESATSGMPGLEETVKSRDAHIEALKSEAGERDAHIRTLLRRMTDLEPLNERISELKAALIRRQEPGPEVAAAAARMRELEQQVAAKDAQIAENEARAAGLNRRLAELEQVAARAAIMEGSLREKNAAVVQLQTANSEQGQSIGAMKQRLDALDARAHQAEQERLRKEQEALKLRAELEELTPLPGRLQDLADKHQSDLTRLKVSSAQRIRRLRQGITGFKS